MSSTLAVHVIETQCAANHLNAMTVCAHTCIGLHTIGTHAQYTLLPSSTLCQVKEKAAMQGWHREDQGSGIRNPVLCIASTSTADKRLRNLMCDA